MTVFEHDNYRDLMKSYLRSLPKSGHGQARKIAQHMGVSSTYLSQVLSGAKAFTAEQGEELSAYLGLSGLEADYFFYLIQLERAGTKKLKTFCSNKLKQIREQSQKLANRVSAQKVLTDEQKAIFYSSALYSAIHLFTSTGRDGRGESGRSFEEIVERFELPRAKVTQILEFLRATGLVLENNGLYTMGTQSTHVEADSPFLLKHHSNWRLRALSAGESLAEEELMYTGNVSLSRKDFSLLREEMIQFIKKFLKQVHASPAEEVASFNLDFFWMRK